MKEAQVWWEAYLSAISGCAVLEPEGETRQVSHAYAERCADAAVQRLKIRYPEDVTK